MIFRCLTHPVFVGRWIVVDEDGRIWRSTGDIFAALDCKRELTARFA